MSKSQRILLVILAVSAGYLIFDMMKHPADSAKQVVRNITSQVEPEKPAPTPTNKPIPTSTLATLRNTELKKAPHYAQLWGRDPFIGELFDMGDAVEVSDEDNGSQEVIQLEDYEFTAISYRADQPTILINKEVLRIGDVIDGMTLESVVENTAYLTKGNQRFILKLKGNF